jgi:integrase
MGDPIKRVVLKDGTVRYRFVIDIGPGPDGKRRQKTFTYDRKRDAQSEYSRMRHEVGRGTFVVPTALTVAELLDQYLAHACRDVEEGTAANYRDALRPARERLGDRKLQTVTEQDIDALVDWMLTSGRRRGGKPGTGLGARSVQLTLGRLRSALQLAVRRQLVPRNVAIDSRIPREARNKAAEKRAERTPWTAEEVRAFLTAAPVVENRLHAAVLLLLMGLRPAEVCGLRWAAVRLDGGKPMLSVETTRTIVDGQAVEKGTKSAAGKRKLPLPSVAVTALREAKRLQAADRLAAGPVYSAGAYVLADELGRPFKTDQLRRRIYLLMAAAGVRKVRPYDARHACLTFLAANGVPDVVVSAWAGHADLSLTKKVYVHPDETHLRPAADRLDALLTHAPGV